MTGGYTRNVSIEIIQLVRNIIIGDVNFEDIPESIRESSEFVHYYLMINTTDKTKLSLKSKTLWTELETYQHYIDSYPFFQDKTAETDQRIFDINPASFSHIDKPTDEMCKTYLNRNSYLFGRVYDRISDKAIAHFLHIHIGEVTTMDVYRLNVGVITELLTIDSEKEFGFNNERRLFVLYEYIYNELYDKPFHDDALYWLITGYKDGFLCYR